MYAMFCSNYDAIGTQILTASVTGRKIHVALLTASEHETANFIFQSHTPQKKEKKKTKKPEQNISVKAL